MAGHFGNQASGAPIDCEAISFLPLADVVSSEYFAVLASAAACSTSRGLNDHVLAVNLS
jgi:hypothetical protein